MATAPAKKPSPAKAPATKTAAAKPAAAKTVPANAPDIPAVRSAEKALKAERAPKPAASTPSKGGTLKARDLIARVAEATGTKAKDIKSTVEATLAELGKSLDAGEMLVLPPLGKLRITPAKAEGGSGPMKLKLNRGAAAGAKKKVEKEPLAAGGEAS